MAKDILQEVYDFISGINQKAYKDIYLLSNQVLSKNPFTNNFLRKYILRKDAGPFNAFRLVCKLSLYYINSIRFYLCYCFNCFLGKMFSPRKVFSGKRKEIVIIDVFFLVDQIENSKIYRDPYFPGLEDVLKKKNCDYAYVPVFYWIRNSFSFIKMLRKLRSQNVPVLPEFRLLTFLDLLHIGYFLLRYPFHVIKLANSLENRGFALKLLRYELFDTLDQVTFLSFSRYLQGRRVAKLPVDSIKVISWYENQVIGKNFLKGLRSGGEKIKTYGAQLFLYPRSCLNIIPDKNERIFGIVPDNILVNGPEFIPRGTNLNFSVGPSLRYSRIFNDRIKKADQVEIVVLLPYSTEDAENILRVISESSSNRRFLVKMHPGFKNYPFKYLSSPKFMIKDEDSYSLFNQAKIVISCGSGTLLEATSLGIPVISIRNPARFDSNPLPGIGKGVIWEEAVSGDEIEKKILQLEKALVDNQDDIARISNEYKKMFFNEISDDAIIKAFEL